MNTFTEIEAASKVCDTVTFEEVYVRQVASQVADYQQDNYVAAMLLGLYEEVSELARAVGPEWKYWKYINKEGNFLSEAADVLIFLINIVASQGITADELVRETAVKIAVNATRSDHVRPVVVE